MRILAISYEYPPVGGGGGQATHEVLTCLNKRGHQVDVVTMRTPGLDAKQILGKNLVVFRVFSGRRDLNHCGLGPTLIYLLTGWRQARVLAKQNSYDVIHATFIFPSALIAWLISRQASVPFVITAHGSDVPGHNKSLNTLFKLLQKIWLEVVLSASSITTISRYLAQKIKHLSGRQAQVIPNGIELGEFLSTNYGPKILIVGRLQKFKNFDQALRGYAKSKAPEQGYQLEIIGDGPDKDRLQTIAKQLGLTVNFHGRISRPDLIKLYSKSSILISASQFESFGGVLMEAMACGLAVISTDVGGCRELVGEAGLIIPANNSQQITAALNKYLVDESLLKRLGRQARQRIKQYYDITSVANAYEDVLKSVLSESKYVSSTKIR